MNILVTGGNGLLGHDVTRRLELLKIPYHSPSRKELDITDSMAVESYFQSMEPDAVLHCAAYTAVDRAEDEREACFAVNSKATEHLARCCAEAGAKLAYISTDYVFDGCLDRPYEVTDTPRPLNCYGSSKYEGECAVQKWLERYFIVRVSWLFGEYGTHFVSKICSLAREREEIAVVADQTGSPTYTADLAVLLTELIQSDQYGIYHATNEGFCSWYDLARDIIELTGSETRVKALLSSEYATKAKRPQNSRLSKKSLDEAGFGRLPHYRDALKRYLSVTTA